MALLGFYRQGGDGAGIKAPQADRLTCLFTKAVGPVFEALQGRFNLGNELALAVAGAQFEGTVGFGRGAVGEIGKTIVVVLEVNESLFAFPENVILPD